MTNVYNCPKCGTRMTETGTVDGYINPYNDPDKGTVEWTEIKCNKCGFEADAGKLYPLKYGIDKGYWVI